MLSVASSAEDRKLATQRNALKTQRSRSAFALEARRVKSPSAQSPNLTWSAEPRRLPIPYPAGPRAQWWPGWWGSFDLAVSVFSGRPADPPADDFITRNAGTAQAVEIGWWPGDARYAKAAFYAYAYPAPVGFAGQALMPPAARWDAALGEYILDWDDVLADQNPAAVALEFARSAFRHACLVCGWDAGLAASADSRPPPVT